MKITDLSRPQKSRQGGLSTQLGRGSTVRIDGGSDPFLWPSRSVPARHGKSKDARSAGKIFKR